MFCGSGKCIARIAPGGNCSRYSEHEDACFKAACTFDGICEQTTPNNELKPTGDWKKPHSESRRARAKPAKSFKKGKDGHDSTRVLAGTETSTGNYKDDLTLQWTELPNAAPFEGSGVTPDSLGELLRDTENVQNLVESLDVEETTPTEAAMPTSAVRKSRQFRNLHIRPLHGAVITDEVRVTSEDDIDKLLELVEEKHPLPKETFYKLPSSVSKSNERGDMTAFVEAPSVATDEKITANLAHNGIQQAHREESSTPYFKGIVINKVPIEKRPTASILAVRPGERLPPDVIPFHAATPFPTVYFRVTVIEGEFKKRARRQRFASGITAYTRGTNMPIGYTQAIEGNTENGTTVLRVLDPRIGGIIVEFNVTVFDRQGRQCEQQCQYGTRNAYRPCISSISRISTFEQYTDDITTYQDYTHAIADTWMGQGYFRRRKPDFLLFKCKNYKRMRRRNQ